VFVAGLHYPSHQTPDEQQVLFSFPSAIILQSLEHRIRDLPTLRNTRQLVPLKRQNTPTRPDGVTFPKIVNFSTHYDCAHRNKRTGI
jgi:hypothetical protein